MFRKTIDKLIITTIVLGIPLYQKFPIFDVPNSFVKIRLEDFLMFFVFCYCLYLYRTKLPSTLLNSLERSIVIFITVGAVSLLSAFFVSKSIDLKLGILHWARRIEYFLPLFFVLGLSGKHKKEYLEYVYKLLLIVILLVFAYGFGQKFFHWPVIVTQNEEVSKGIAQSYVPGSHLVSTFAGHYDLAAFLVFLLPLVAVGAYTSKDKFWKIISLCAFILGLWVLSNTLSRISVLSYFLAISICFILLGRIKVLIAVLVVSLAVFSLSSNLIGRYVNILVVINDRISTLNIIDVAYASGDKYNPGKVLAVIEDRSTSIRFNIEWPRALRAFSKNPLLGTGYSSITLATDNDYLRLLGEVGILGFLSFLLVVFNIIIKSLTLWIKKGFTKDMESIFLVGILGGIAGTLVNAIFIDVFEASKFAIIFWFITGFVVYIVRSYKHETS